MWNYRQLQTVRREFETLAIKEKQSMQEFLSRIFGIWTLTHYPWTTLLQHCCWLEDGAWTGYYLYKFLNKVDLLCFIFLLAPVLSSFLCGQISCNIDRVLCFCRDVAHCVALFRNLDYDSRLYLTHLNFLDFPLKIPFTWKAFYFYSTFS